MLHIFIGSYPTQSTTFPIASLLNSTDHISLAIHFSVKLPVQCQTVLKLFRGMGSEWLYAVKKVKTDQILEI